MATLDLDGLRALPETIVHRLADAAAEAGYDEQVIARTEAIGPGHLDAVRLPLVHGWLRGLDDPWARWARVFGYADRVAETTVRELMGAEVTDALLGAGVLTPAGGDALRSQLRLMPFAGLLVASDEASAAQDPVMGPGATTLELWRALAPAGGSLLDVGCGAGTLALAAARAGAVATGVDIDPRAIALSRFNARLNRLDVRFETGDLLEPVAGERFDLVVSQPPFVTRPPTVAATTYLHGGVRGDELTHRLLAALPDAIADGGRALVLFDSPVEEHDGASVLDRVRATLGERPCQLIAVVADGHSADRQAIGYAAAAHPDLGPRYDVACRTYREHLRTLGILRCHHVLLHLRPIAHGTPAFAAELGARASIYDAAALAQAERALALASSSDEALLAATVRVSPHARIVIEQRPAQTEAPSLHLRFAAGRARDQELSHAAAALLEIFANAATVGAVLEAYAEACGTTPDEVRTAVLGFTREALVAGSLLS